MLLYYITDRTQFPGPPARQRERLLATAVAAARAGVDLIQVREKDLSARELETLTRELMRELQSFPQTRLLVNSRADVAIAAGAHGVHLPANDISVSEARAVFSKAGVDRPIIAVSCHTTAEMEKAESHGADFAVLGPIFEKEGKRIPAAGLAVLREACNRPAAAAARMPVLALGGVTLENAGACMSWGAAGIAGFRLFQRGNIGDTVKRLRELQKHDTSRREASPHPYWINTASSKKL